jgi:hypothetical protein
MDENLIDKLIPHQGCVIRRNAEDDIELSSENQDWVMASALLPQVYRAPFALHVIGTTNSTNLRLYWHRGEAIFNWECSVSELRVHDPGTGEQTAVKGKGFIKPSELHDILWQVRLDGMKLIVDREVRYECSGSYAGIESTLAVGPCFGSTVTIREFKVGAPGGG